LEEASYDLGENAWWTFWRVTFPNVLPGIVASLLLTFTISFDEFIMAFFLGSTNPTLPVFMWNQLRFPKLLPGVLALGACILIASVFIVLLAEWFRRRNTSETQTGDMTIG
jgi:spermidine/putrescine transport system permease protein